MNTVIILLGPTGVGKTGASVLLARELGTEIISADSMQIYRGMDIGTAKPSAEERAAVRHHMIDIVDPSASFSTGQYISAIAPTIEGLHKRGKVPLIVGGTGLYIRAITRGIFSGPSADWDLREELITMEEETPGFLFSYLGRLDPDAAARIGRNDHRRLVRALEVCLKSSATISAMQDAGTRPLPYRFVRIGLTRERKELYRMIDDRVEAMIKAGLIDEVKKLMESAPDRTPLQAIGYKECILYLRGEIDIEEAVRLVKRNTRRYAKRQFSWFKTEEGINWVDVTGIHENRTIHKAVKKALMASSPGIFPESGPAEHEAGQ